jgi:hypothetical protein
VRADREGACRARRHLHCDHPQHRRGATDRPVHHRRLEGPDRAVGRQGRHAHIAEPVRPEFLAGRPRGPLGME